VQAQSGFEQRLAKKPRNLDCSVEFRQATMLSWAGGEDAALLNHVLEVEGADLVPSNHSTKTNHGDLRAV